ncbi:uncharacterized protein LOC132719009 isoform X3 [Ruditapes philippinarum]|uniref:uncharacterized protein LOC132719009 isoform X3 n=1 Tax=Ruditapes philippinarum TaxID=129788 RepID=UPI00295BF84C|nr:uncharacterized protein LOC132719009 isoform X3 [Ruditapes philippinarum]XP_060558727.1 uncharacterized protein LOC132719009 isoform X3 [Ruditapes philippinarum]
MALTGTSQQNVRAKKKKKQRRFDSYLAKRTHMIQHADHDYVHKPRRNLIQTSKKLDCPAKIIIRSIVRFPDYKVMPLLIMFPYFRQKQAVT